MSRIQQVFAACAAKHKRALVPFLTAGDPDLDATLQFMQQLVASGADIIELGIPFSDPMADGPVIQRASERALKSGTRLIDVFTLVKKFRQSDQVTPVVLMGYLNPVEAMGYDAFARQAGEAGVDGVLTVDMPVEEAGEYAEVLAKYDLAPIFMLAPTSTEERIQAVAKYARGYVYYVSIKGVTGTTLADFSSVTAKVEMIQKHIELPVVVGFGIRDEAAAKAVAKVADGVVIGSRLVEIIAASARHEAQAGLKAFLTSIRTAMDAA